MMAQSGSRPENGQRFRGQWEPGRDPIGDQGVLDFGYTPRDRQRFRLRDCRQPVEGGGERGGCCVGATPPLGESGGCIRIRL